jgi:sugar lactone lactonase YvrE
MNQIFLSKRGLTPASIGAAIFCLLLIVGCVISPRRTVGGGTGGTPTPTPTATPTPNPAAAGKLYVLDTNANSIFRYDNAFTVNGNPTPAATIVGLNTTLNFPGFITLDAAADRLYVANTSDVSVLIFDNISTKSGTVNLTPSRTIFGAATTLASPADVSFDRVRNELYVLDDPKILVFGSASLATGGNVSPTRSLSTAFTLGASAIFLDAANDRLFAADADGAIAIYDNASTLPTGAINPSRTITGAATQLGNPDGIQIDGLGRLVISNAGNSVASIPASITIYSSAAIANGGNVAPVAQIAGTNTGFSTPSQIVIDPSGNGTVYLADPGAARVAVYANMNTANGNINTAPNRSISGASTGLTPGGPLGVAIDNTR